MESVSSKEYRGISALEGPVLVLKGGQAVGFGERVEIRSASGEIRQGRVLRTMEDMTVVQVFQGTRGLSADETRIRFLGEPFRLEVSREMLGRVLDGTGRPRFQILIQRAYQALEDRNFQQQIFTSIEDLTPQMNRIQSLRAASRFI